MADIRVRNVDDWVIHALRARAAREGRSLSKLACDILTVEAMRPRREMLARIEAWHEELIKRHGILADSTPGIRAEREGRA